MIVPVTPESVWTAFLSTVPARELPAVRTLLILSPHPDDETLGCAGLIQHQLAVGGEVIVAAATDGEFAYPGEPGLAQTRRREQQNALARLGLAADRIHHFALPDGDLASHETELASHLTPLLTPGTRIVTPWLHDFHPDHEACARAAATAASQTGAALSSYFFWTWHRGTPALLAGLPIYRLPLTPAAQGAKEEALQCHASQLYRSAGDPILPELLLAPSRRPFEVFLDA